MEQARVGAKLFWFSLWKVRSGEKNEKESEAETLGCHRR